MDTSKIVTGWFGMVFSYTFFSFLPGFFLYRQYNGAVCYAFIAVSSVLLSIYQELDRIERKS